MHVTISIDRAGRIVVPKPIRDHLGLREGSLLEIEVSGGKIHATPAPDPVAIDLNGGFPIIRGMVPLERGAIIRAIKADREARDQRRKPKPTARGK